MSNSNIERLARWLPLLVSFVALCAIALHTASFAAVGSIWDDSYITVRYAHNILLHGVASWNGVIPTWGFTSTLQVLFTLPFAAISNNPTVVAICESVFGMILFLISIPFLVGTVVPRSDVLVRRVCVAASFTFIALAAYPFGTLASSGMDTMLAIAFVSLYFALMVRASRSLSALSRMRLIGLGVIGACAFLVRPDLLLFSVLLPGALALWSQTKEERMRAWIILAATAATLCLILFAAWAYFGTPVPLPFYGKSGFVLGETIRKRFLFQPILQLIAYIDAHKFLFLALGAATAARWRLVFKRGEHAIYVGVFASVFAFIGYYLFFVIQIMGGDSRFYYPTLPALLMIASVVIGYCFKKYRENGGDRMQTLCASVMCAVLLAGLFTPFMWGAQQFSYEVARARVQIKTVWSDNIISLYRHGGGYQRTWPCLDVFATLPNDASIATTEAGMSSVININATLVDLAGLNSTDISLGRISFDRAIISGKIDLVYLPWRVSYPEMRNAILSSGDFKANYEVFKAEEMGSLDDVAIRTNSPYAPQLRACLKNVIAAHSAAALAPAAPANQSDQFYDLTFPFPLQIVN